MGRECRLFFELVRGDTGGTDRTIPHSKITTLHYWCRTTCEGKMRSSVEDSTKLQQTTCKNYHVRCVLTSRLPQEGVAPSQVCLTTNKCTYLPVVPVCHWMRSIVERGSKTSSPTPNRNIWDGLTSALVDSTTWDVDKANVHSAVLS